MYRKEDDPPESPKAVNLARIVFRLLTDSRGVLVSDLLDEFNIKERTLRNYRQTLQEMPEFLDSNGCSLVGIEGRGTERRLMLRHSEDGEMPEIAYAVRFASLNYARQTFQFLGDTALGEGIAEFCQDYVARFRNRTYVLRDLPKDGNRKFYYLPYAPKDYTGRGSDVKTIINALTLNRRLSITYESSREPGPRIVLPLTLVMWKSALYLIVMSSDRTRTYMMALDRIKSVKLQRHTFVYPHPGLYDPAKMLDGGFGIFVNPERREREFVILFAPDSALHRDVQERTWHKSQRFETLPDGRLKMTFKVTSDTEVWPWIHSFGDKAQVLSPQGE